MMNHTFTSERYGETMTFYDTMETIYKLLHDRSIRVFGTRAERGMGDVQIKRGVFKNALEVYLPNDDYDVAHVSEVIDILDQSFLVSFND